MAYQFSNDPFNIKLPQGSSHQFSNDLFAIEYIPPAPGIEHNLSLTNNITMSSNSSKQSEIRLRNSLTETTAVIKGISTNELNTVVVTSNKIDQNTVYDITITNYVDLTSYNSKESNKLLDTTTTSISSSSQSIGRHLLLTNNITTDTTSSEIKRNVLAMNLKPQTISAGYDYSVAIKSDRKLVAWGSEIQYETEYYLAPVTLENATGIKYISSGHGNTVVLKQDGSLLSYGAWSNNGEQGQPSTEPPLGNDFIAVAAGSDSSFALKANGTVVGWGKESTFAKPTDTDIVAIAANRSSLVCLKSNGSLVRWDPIIGITNDYLTGSNFVKISGKEGCFVGLRSDGTYTSSSPLSGNFPRIDFPTGNDFVDVAVGFNHIVFLKLDGSIVCCGSDYYGQCSEAPIGNDFIEIAAGGSHSVAKRSDGTLVSWGLDTSSQVSSTPTGNNFIEGINNLNLTNRLRVRPVINKSSDINLLNDMSVTSTEDINLNKVYHVNVTNYIDFSTFNTKGTNILLENIVSEGSDIIKETSSGQSNVVTITATKQGATNSYNMTTTTVVNMTSKITKSIDLSLSNNLDIKASTTKDIDLSLLNDLDIKASTIKNIDLSLLNDLETKTSTTKSIDISVVNELDSQSSNGSLANLPIENVVDINSSLTKNVDSYHVSTFEMTSSVLSEVNGLKIYNVLVNNFVDLSSTSIKDVKSSLQTKLNLDSTAKKDSFKPLINVLDTFTTTSKRVNINIESEFDETIIGPKKDISIRKSNNVKNTSRIVNKAIGLLKIVNLTVMPIAVGLTGTALHILKKIKTTISRIFKSKTNINK